MARWQAHWIRAALMVLAVERLPEGETAPSPTHQRRWQGVWSTGLSAELLAGLSLVYSSA